jgi:hypothetical protein
MVNEADPHDRNLDFLDWSRYSFYQVTSQLCSLLSCTFEAERNPFQTQYFSENLVAPGIEPGPLDL